MSKITLQFSTDTVCGYLRKMKPKTVLLQCFHGLGDAITFYANCLPVLKKEFPRIKFFFQTWRGQQEMFGEVEPDESHYDCAIALTMPCSEWDADADDTKAERTMSQEIGITSGLQKDVYRMPKKFGSPLIGVHFQSTSCEDISVNEWIAAALWRKIEDAGLIPIDMSFRRSDLRTDTIPYDFETRKVDGSAATIANLFGLMSHLGGFAGCASGDFWTALCCLPPERILYLETIFPVEKLTRLPVLHAKNETDPAVDAWIENVKKYQKGQTK